MQAISSGVLIVMLPMMLLRERRVQPAAAVE
jgi:hypothetical protein